MKARILPLVDGRYLPQIKPHWFSQWCAAIPSIPGSNGYLWSDRRHYHWAVQATREQATASLACFGVTHFDMVKP